MEQLALRIWLPDRPGVLGVVATTIGAHSGNVVGLEVLDREGGVAVDELTVELPAPGLAEDVANALGEIEGVGVEDVRRVDPDTEERGLQVMSAAVAILETVNSPAAVVALIGYVGELFSPEWYALADLGTPGYLHPVGCVPPLAWLEAFVSGARTSGPGTDTTGSGVIVEHMPAADLFLCVGRSVPFRRRERREIEMLVRVSDRVWTALAPVRAEHRSWR